MAKVCKKATVHGLVQGVFFRISTQQQAIHLGLSGYVRNCSDGTVEVVACGEQQDVNKLMAWLHVGSQQSRVERVVKNNTEWFDYPSFEVQR